jgi:hypothetical protein
VAEGVACGTAGSSDTEGTEAAAEDDGAAMVAATGMGALWAGAEALGVDVFCVTFTGFAFALELVFAVPFAVPFAVALAFTLAVTATRRAPSA